MSTARAHLPMVEIGGSVDLHGPFGAVRLPDLFYGRDELIVHQHIWHDGAPRQGQCEGGTTVAWHLDDLAYPDVRGVSFATVTSG